MCGIFGYIGPKNAADVVLEGLKRLEYRGYDSWGVAVVADQIKVNKKVGALSHFPPLTSHFQYWHWPYQMGHSRRYY